MSWYDNTPPSAVSHDADDLASNHGATAQHDDGHLLWRHADRSLMQTAEIFCDSDIHEHAGLQMTGDERATTRTVVRPSSNTSQADQQQ